MITANCPSPSEPAPPVPADWPLEVRAVFEALSRPAPVERERRAKARTPCRGTARVWFLTPAQQPSSKTPAPIYLRDFCPGAVSFLTQTWLTPELLVDLEMPAADGACDGAPKLVRCRVHRCRQFRGDWFEGVLRVVPAEPAPARKGLWGLFSR